MADFTKIIGMIINEMTPVALKFAETRRVEAELVANKKLTAERFADLKEIHKNYGKGITGRKGEEDIPCDTCKDNSGLLSKIWVHLHTIPSTMPFGTLPKEVQQRYSNYVRTTIMNVPCHECVVHAGEYIQAHPIDASSREALSRWLCIYHNSVSEKLGKPIRPC